jgi:leucyl-tRNA synthetase
VRTVPVPDSELPIVLPEVQSYKPTGTGESPLAAQTDWVNTTCPKCGGPAKRETNTMPNGPAPAGITCDISILKTKRLFATGIKWNTGCLSTLRRRRGTRRASPALPRFWHKFLFDNGLVNTDEPFVKLRNQGIILGENGEKMSKSRGNVINPDDIIRDFGADTLRMYEMFMGPLDVMKPWQTAGVIGVYKFIQKVWRLFNEYEITDKPADPSIIKLMHKTVKKVGQDIDSLNNFNTGISQMMIFANELGKQNEQNREVLTTLAKLLSPYAPHLGEELWEILGNPPTIAFESWPTYDEALTIDDTYVMVVQINGKVRDNIEMPRGTDPDSMKSAALASEKTKQWTDGKEILKVIPVKDKLVNIVVKG